MTGSDISSGIQVNSALARAKAWTTTRLRLADKGFLTRFAYVWLPIQGCPALYGPGRRGGLGWPVAAAGAAEGAATAVRFE